MFSSDTGALRTDRQTDRIAISISRVGVLTREENEDSEYQRKGSNDGVHNENHIIVLKCSQSRLSTVIFATRCYAASYAVMRYLSVCLCGCPSRSKRVNTFSIFFHPRVATPFWFFHTKPFSNISTGTS